MTTGFVTRLLGFSCALASIIFCSAIASAECTWQWHHHQSSGYSTEDECNSVRTALIPNEALPGGPVTSYCEQLAQAYCATTQLCSMSIGAPDEACIEQAIGGLGSEKLWTFTCTILVIAVIGDVQAQDGADSASFCPANYNELSSYLGWDDSDGSDGAGGCSEDDDGDGICSDQDTCDGDDSTGDSDDDGVCDDNDSCAGDDSSGDDDGDGICSDQDACPNEDSCL